MILQKQSGLGRGLGALIPPKQTQKTTPQNETEQEGRPARSIKHGGSAGLVHEIPVELISANTHQPRRYFDEAQLEELAESIREHGILQPLVVTLREDGTYELIAGERRFRAAKLAGLTKVPVIVRDATEQQKLELALIENIQRQQLNPMEEAHAYTRLIQEFDLTQEEAAKRVGKSRSQVANTIRLLQLPTEIQQGLAEGKISQSNARTLLALPTDGQRLVLYHAMLKGNYSVRETEERVVTARRGQDPNVVAAENTLRSKYHCKVKIHQRMTGSGEVKFTFTNSEELEELIKKLSGQE